jgi:CheY-like chemotaxis protein
VPEFSLDQEVNVKSGNGKKILIVDDDAVIVKTLSTKLAASGYSLVTTHDGWDAINALRQEKADLILLDIHYPLSPGHGGAFAWNGFFLLSWMRRLEEAKDIPIVVITGDDSAQCRKKALEAGAAGFLHKPIKPEELMTVVGQALEPPAPKA